jgi:hypothetical protein
MAARHSLAEGGRRDDPRQAPHQVRAAYIITPAEASSISRYDGVR